MKKIDFEKLLEEKRCECGRIHGSTVKKIIMKSGALNELCAVIDCIGKFKHICMVCDENTYEVAGKKVESMISLAKSAVLDPHDLHANEKAVDMAQSKLPDEADLLLAVGSGTVHDITRYVAYCRGIQFISIPTAASVDGFVSSVAAMTWHGVKRTLTACAPVAMVADIDIIAEAPMRLTASGVGDMLGKYTSLLDWKIGNILTGEYICPYIIGLVEEAVKNVRGSLKKLCERDREATALLMYGLVLSGIAMQFSGNSRPASGAEHHISHFIEMTISAEKCSALHGEKVGVGLVLVSRLYHNFASISESLPVNQIHDYTCAEREFIKEKFGDLKEEIYKENENDC